MWELEYLSWLESTANAVIKLRREGREATLAYLAWSGKMHHDHEMFKNFPPTPNGLLFPNIGDGDWTLRENRPSMGNVPPEQEGEFVGYDPWVFEWLAQVEEWDTKLAARMANANSDKDNLTMDMKRERRHHGPRIFESRWIRGF